MTRRRWGLVALWVFGLWWILAAEWVSIDRGVRENHLLDALAGISFIAAAVVILDQRPGNRLGWLLYASGLANYAGNYENLRTSGTPLMLVVGSLGIPLAAQLVLAYPSGRLRTTYERVTVVAIYLAAVVPVTVMALTEDPPADCDCAWLPRFWPNLRIYQWAWNIGNGSTFVLAPMFVVALWLRWHRASHAERRELRALWVAAGLLATVVTMQAVDPSNATTGFPYLMWEFRTILISLLPLVFLFGLLSSRLARGAVGGLVVDLQGLVVSGDIGPLVARTLGDPTAQILYAVDGSRWIDASGRPAELPNTASVNGSARQSRGVALVERDGVVLAAIVHDPALDTDLVREVTATAAMAIENERLHAEIRAQLEEVRASRARIVEAGDAERQRVERDLHDGAQQRLLSLSLALHTARRQVAEGADGEVDDTLRRAAEELREAINELRELARGIHPAILTEEGLGPAVRSLADRATLPVSILRLPSCRYPASVEATSYFVVSEALANVTKYASASHAWVSVISEPLGLEVEVGDDGVGGADPRAGSGLRGLEDRLAAIGGRLSVTSPLGEGTVVRASLPVPASTPVPAVGGAT